MPAAQKPDGYVARIVDAQMERYLRLFGIVEVAGTKWCGKRPKSKACYSRKEKCIMMQ